MGIKIIFLDIDGVLNCKTTRETHCGTIGVEQRFIDLLKEIVEATDAKVVLTSTWRLGWKDLDYGMPTPRTDDFLYLKDKLAASGIVFLSKTPSSATRHRGQEIVKWLQCWGGEPIDEYIIIDDDIYDLSDTKECQGHIIETSWSEGLKKGAVNMAIRMLNKAKK